MKVLTASLQHFIVQKLKISNKQAVEYIVAGRIQVNHKKGYLQQTLLPEDEVVFEEQVLQAPRQFLYVAYYKPRGVESTLNRQIPNNLEAALKLNQRVFPVGRLDKESEGLMLLTDNGKIYDKIIHAESHQEKEYLVTVNKPLTPETLEHLATGVVIMGQKTRPAVVKQVSTTSFNIILTQGLNRQIRRMCYKLGFEVRQLVRLRIISISLDNLKPGEWRYLSPAEVQQLTHL